MFFHVFNSFTKLGRHHHPLDRIAEINGLLSGVVLYPQVLKAFMSKSVTGLSLPQPY
ncbi:MAG: hypothetical protein ACD_57C00402G0003 [uncultured bacterium]|nr:MAG: hypothetical protein ACD_57C00402G0003 [uncultured bacterium]